MHVVSSVYTRKVRWRKPRALLLLVARLLSFLMAQGVAAVLLIHTKVVYKHSYSMCAARTCYAMLRHAMLCYAHSACVTKPRTLTRSIGLATVIAMALW